MSRVLCVGGRALIYVWAKDQKKKEMSSYLKQNKKNRDGGAEGKEHVDRETGEFGLPVHINRFERKTLFFWKKMDCCRRTQFQHQDNLVPWKLKGGEEEEEKVDLLNNQTMKRLQTFYPSEHRHLLFFLLPRCFSGTITYLKRGS